MTIKRRMAGFGLEWLGGGVATLLLDRTLMCFMHKGGR